MVEEDTVRLCGDPFPHIKREGDDLTTCMLLCVKPAGHRPETPHKCIDGCEWTVDALPRGSLPPVAGVGVDGRATISARHSLYACNLHCIRSVSQTSASV